MDQTDPQMMSWKDLPLTQDTDSKGDMDKQISHWKDAFTTEIIKLFEIQDDILHSLSVNQDRIPTLNVHAQEEIPPIFLYF